MKTFKEIVKDYEKKSRKEILSEVGHLTIEQLKYASEVEHLKKENRKLYEQTLYLKEKMENPFKCRHCGHRADSVWGRSCDDRDDTCHFDVCFK